VSRSEYISTRIDGLNAVVRALLAMGLDVEDLRGAFSEIARFGAVLAARHAPRRSGRLAGDIRGNRARNKAVIAAGRVAVPYAGPINYGWAARGIKPSGFMQKADEELQPYALRVLEHDINAQIRSRGLA
jgi:hypothetical protein